MRTMATAGRAVVFSGATVAIGLALLLFMPLPFMRSMGVGGFLIPLVSIAAAHDAAARAALGLRAARDRRVHVADWLRRLRVPLPRLPGRRTSSTASGRGSRGRSCAGRVAFLAVGAAALVAARGAGARARS